MYQAIPTAIIPPPGQPPGFDQSLIPHRWEFDANLSPPCRNATSNRKFEAKLESQSQSFTNAESVQSVSHDMNMCDLTSRHAWMEVRFGFKKKIGSLSEGSIPIIFISMHLTWPLSHKIGQQCKRQSNKLGIPCQEMLLN